MPLLPVSCECAVPTFQPFVFHWRIFRDEVTVWRVIVYLINIIFGLFLTVTGEKEWWVV